MTQHNGFRSSRCTAGELEIDDIAMDHLSFRTGKFRARDGVSLLQKGFPCWQRPCFLSAIADRNKGLEPETRSFALHKLDDIVCFLVVHPV